MITKCIVHAPEWGFGIDVSTMKATLERIYPDGRQPYERGIPSNAAIKTNRALNRDVTYRDGESKEKAKNEAESFAHVNTFVTALQKIQAKYPDIFEKADKVRNLDETHVDGEFEQRIKKFCGSHSNHGSYTACQKDLRSISQHYCVRISQLHSFVCYCSRQKYHAAMA